MGTEVAAKLERLRGLMAARGVGALLLTRQENFAWLTGGARGHVGLASEGSVAWALVTANGLWVITSAIEAPRMQHEELLGFPAEVLPFPWHDEAAREVLVRELAGSGMLGADIPFPGAANLATVIAPLRWTLLPAEQERARATARAAATALEETCRAISPGQTEHEIAALLGARVAARGMEAVVNLVATDERVYQFRHPLPGPRRLQRYAMLVLGARQRGLYISASRLVHFGAIPPDLFERLAAVARVDAAIMASTRPGARVAAVWEALAAAYAAAGYPGEWERHHQGGLAGYLGREYRAAPGCPYTVEAGQLFAWNPSIAGVKSEDTMLATAAGPEILTETGEWPTLTVTAGGLTLRRPGILERS